MGRRSGTHNGLLGAYGEDNTAVSVAVRLPIFVRAMYNAVNYDDDLFCVNRGIVLIPSANAR